MRACVTERAAQISEIKKKISTLEEELAETKRRLPAHSVKPPVMMALFDLEDRLEQLYQELQALQ